MDDEEFIKIRREIESMTIDEIRAKFNLRKMDLSELRILDAAKDRILNGMRQSGGETDGCTPAGPFDSKWR